MPFIDITDITGARALLRSEDLRMINEPKTGQASLGFLIGEQGINIVVDLPISEVRDRIVAIHEASKRADAAVWSLNTSE